MKGIGKPIDSVFFPIDFVNGCALKKTTLNDVFFWFIFFCKSVTNG